MRTSWELVWFWEFKLEDVVFPWRKTFGIFVKARRKSRHPGYATPIYKEINFWKYPMVKYC